MGAASTFAKNSATIRRARWVSWFGFRAEPGAGEPFNVLASGALVTAWREVTGIRVV